MLSSLTSFIPNALRDTVRSTSFRPDNEEDVRMLEVQQSPPEQVEWPKEPASRKKERERRANEVFVVVRPPPSKTNHPLNLQVQLVPPHSRGVLPRQSIDSEIGTTTTLRRSSSTRSQESSTTYGSTSSFASTVSTGSSSASSSRRIVPLYNLQAHNVLPNIIVDAGTDAKIAKFQKRGIELIDLALLEPVEVWPDPNAVTVPATAVTSTLSVPMVGPGASTSTLGRLSVDEMGFPHVSARAGSRGVPTSLATPVTAGAGSGRPTIPYDSPNTATSSNASLSSASQGAYQTNHSVHPGTLELQDTPPNSAALAQNNNRRSVFGRIFRKATKDSSTPPGSPPIPPLASVSVPRSAGLRQPLSARLESSSQPATPRPDSARLQRQETQGSVTESHDQSGTPTQLQHTVTPTPQQHPQMSLKDSRPAPGSSKRTSGLRSSWLIGSSNSSQRPSQSVSSPLVAVFSSLGAKRRSQVNSGQTTESPTAINLPGLDEESPQTTNLNPAQAHASVSQAQPQLSSAVLGIQPSMVMVPTSFTGASHSYRGRKSKSPKGDKKRCAERRDDPSETAAKLPKERRKHYRRPVIYAWLVRKWMKRRPPLPPASLTGHGQDQHKGFGLGLNFGGVGSGFGVHIHKDRELGVEEIVEVRFEWRRAPMVTSSKKKLDAGTNNEAVESSAGTEDQGRRSGERRSMDEVSQRKNGDGKVVKKDGGFDSGNDERARKPSASSIASARAAAKRWSLVSHHSQSTTGASESADGHTGDESDPEDSETPWVCTLKVRRTSIAKESDTSATPSPKDGSGRSKGDNGGVHSEGKVKGQDPQGMQQEVLRIKVGTLSPTPHHPKVVAMLKMPFPLPDVQVERLGVLKRRGLAPLTQQGADPEKENYYGLTLTAEEIKDIVCSTSLWLVVRESIGGVGKVQRKGDGWMIRS